MAETPIRNVRVEDKTWTAAQQRAKHDGVALSELIRDWLDAYVNGAKRGDVIARARLQGYGADIAELIDQIELITADLEDIRQRLISGD